jgi:Fe-S cluster biogenesis protein NfuA
MTTRPDAREFQSRLSRLDALIREAEHAADPAVREHTREIVEALLELHGVGLGRLLEHVAAAGAAGATVLDACARDELVAGLLLLHDLHPLSVEARVRQALESVRPYLRTHGGSVELVGLDDGVVRLRLQGSCHSCPSSAVTVKQTIEEAVYGKAPEMTAVVVEGLAEEAPAGANGRGRIALPMV